METLKKVFSNDPCQKYYTLTRTLGTGSFATVKLAVCKADNTKWAVKVTFLLPTAHIQNVLCSYIREVAFFYVLCAVLRCGLCTSLDRVRLMYIAVIAVIERVL
jgi:hypothetical protein